MSSSKPNGLMVVGDRYRLKRKIGSGAFGSIFLGMCWL